MFYAGQVDAIFGASQGSVTLDPTAGADKFISVTRGLGDAIYVASSSGGKLNLTRLSDEGTSAQTINTNIDVSQVNVPSIAVDPQSGRVAVAIADVTQNDPTEFVSGPADHLLVSVFDFTTLGPVTTFDGDGTRDLQFRTDSVHMAWQADGKLLVGADGDTATEHATGDNDLEIFLTRLNADGSTDTGFGAAGVLEIKDDVTVADLLRQQRSLDGLAVRSDGKILVASALGAQAGQSDTVTNWSVDVFRLNADGTRDTAYSGDGRVTLDQQSDDANATSTLTIEGTQFNADGSASVFWHFAKAFVGTSQYKLATLAADGTTAPAAVGFTGTFTFNQIAFEPQQLAVDSAGRFIIAGNIFASGTSFDAFAVRYNHDGTLDTSYANGGTARVALDTNGESMRSGVFLQSSGKLIVAGSSGTSANPTILLTRLQGGDGKPTLTLNSKGTLIVTSYDTADLVYVRTRHSDGRVVVDVNGYVQTFAPTKVKRVAVFTAGGNDTIINQLDLKGIYVDAGDGDDALNGGAGDDVLLGGGGKDKIYGNDGNDILLGGAGNDYLLGGAGKDDLFGNGGVDTLSGAGGNDRLFGGDGADRISGGSGTDSAASDAQDTYDGIETMLA